MLYVKKRFSLRYLSLLIFRVYADSLSLLGRCCRKEASAVHVFYSVVWHTNWIHRAKAAIFGQATRSHRGHDCARAIVETFNWFMTTIDPVGITCSFPCSFLWICLFCRVLSSRERVAQPAQPLSLSRYKTLLLREKYLGRSCLQVRIPLPPNERTNGLEKNFKSLIALKNVRDTINALIQNWPKIQVSSANKRFYSAQVLPHTSCPFSSPCRRCLEIWESDQRR